MPRFPPSFRDASLLGGSVFDLLAHERGLEACVKLALNADDDDIGRTVEQSFQSSVADVRLRWRTHLDGLARPEPSVELGI